MTDVTQKVVQQLHAAELRKRAKIPRQCSVCGSGKAPIYDVSMKDYVGNARAHAYGHICESCRHEAGRLGFDVHFHKGSHNLRLSHTQEPRFLQYLQTMQQQQQQKENLNATQRLEERHGAET